MHSGQVRRVVLALSRCTLPVVLSAAATLSAFAQDASGPRVDREQMWWAPTAEDWKRSCLVQWQRTWEDAVAVSRETGKAILVCVNMDGEIASEHYAGVRYRQPEIAKLYEPYVCVIASVYRHTPRDFDEEGRRIPCPRFGTVTCGEHIAIEPFLYERFMDGQRIAPRHIGVELDGKEMYDVYLAWDTDTIFNALRDGIAKRPAPPPTVIRGDRPIVERVASRDSQDRAAVESAYLQGDRARKRALLETAIARSDAAPIDLLRLAVFGLDVELSQLARRGLAQTSAPEATDLIGEAIRVPMEATEREALIGALARIGESSPRARTLASVHRGLSGRSAAVDVERWSSALRGGGTYAPAVDDAALESRIVNQDAVFETKDPAKHVELAEALLARAVEHYESLEESPGRAADPKAGQEFARLLFRDAHRTAQKAEMLGATGWSVNAVLAIASSFLGEEPEAQARAEAAVKALPAEAPSWNAAAVLKLFAEARWDAILKAVREKKDWPPQWLTDVDSAYKILARHPFGTDANVAVHYDILRYFNATGQAARVLDEGLVRFPDSGYLHDRLRRRLVEERGIEGLEAAYEAMLRQKDAHPSAAWFAGYASIVAAEYHRRAGNGDQALASYDRAVAHFDRSIETSPDSRASADHQAALAIAGRARIALERQDYERAVAEILASFERGPNSAATLDGLWLSPVATAQTLLARLREAKREDLAARVDAGLKALDPAMLLPPDFERVGPPPDARRGRRRPPAGG